MSAGSPTLQNSQFAILYIPLLNIQFYAIITTNFASSFNFTMSEYLQTNARLLVLYRIMLYEITYILKPELTDEEQIAINSAVSEQIKSLEGKPNETERTFSAQRGGTDENHLRKFAYPIKHYRQGYYYTSTFELDPSKLSTLESSLSREGAILRFLIVKDFVELSEIPVKAIVEKAKEEAPTEAPKVE